MAPTIRQRFPLSWAGVAVPGDHAAVRTAPLPPGTRVIPLPREDAAPVAELSIHDRGDVVVVSLRGEVDLLGATVLQAHLSDIRCRGWPRSVADLTGPGSHRLRLPERACPARATQRSAIFMPPPLAPARAVSR